MRIMQNIIEAIGNHLFNFEMDRILQVVIKGVDHINRFVREISYFVIKAVFSASRNIFDHEISKEQDQIEEESKE